MKIGVIGSRNFKNYILLKYILDKVINNLGSTSFSFCTLDDTSKDKNEITGLSYFLSKYCYVNKYNIELYKIKWKDFSDPTSIRKEKNGYTYNANAIRIRNRKFFEEIDFLIVIHNNERYILNLVNDFLDYDKDIMDFNLDIIKK